LLHEGAYLRSHLVELCSVVVALLLSLAALLVEFHHLHDGLAAVKLFHGQAAYHVLRILVDKL
jgi:hypothetical protein